MGCCVIAVMIVGQILELWRRLKVFCGISAELYPDPDVERVTVPFAERIRALLRRPAMRTALVLLLVAEAATAGAWLWSDHKEHLRSGGEYVSRLLSSELESAICSSSEIAAGQQSPLSAVMQDRARRVDGATP